MSSQQQKTLMVDGASERHNLELAFRSFSEVSAQLANSYEELQIHVSELQQELVESNEAKQRASRDKENLATRLENLLALLPGGVVVLDSYGYVEQCNPAAMDFLGNDIEGRKWTEIIKETFSPRSDDGHEISLRDGRRVSIATRSMIVGEGRNGRGQLILLTDQTETRELQSQLARRDRLSTMGKMVAYLAHQIRTPLSSAMLYGGHLKSSELDEVQHQDFAEKLLRQLKNVERQISDLLIFARGSSAAEETIDMAGLFELLNQEIAGNSLYESLDVQYDNAAMDTSILCNAQAFISAMLNLINNAREAHQEAELTRQLVVRISATVDKNRLKICVEDNGPGICQSDIDRVLEPFYTTKSKGTGLGLAVVQAVLKSLGGSLDLKSGLDEGLQVLMEIPLS